MQLIYVLMTVLLLLVNLAGLTAVCSRLLPAFALARAAGVLLFCTVMFFVEHFIGLGQLTWLWPISTALAAFALYKQWRLDSVRRFMTAEAVFVAAFLYGCTWKWFFPDIYPSSERITDLYFIGNYLPGETLPPLDHWFPPHRFDFYYAFQHYAAALMGRILGLAPGLSYNIAFAVIMALTVTLVWDFASRWLDAYWKRLLIVLSFVIGGTGATPFVHLAYQPAAHLSDADRITAVNNRMWASQRFIGSIDLIQNTTIGAKFVGAEKAAGKEVLELPLEDFGYQYYVGDYHPPLGGFLLLMMAIAAMGALEWRLDAVPGAPKKPKQTALAEPEANDFLLQALLVFTVPLTITTNTWVFPLQALMVLAWMAWRWLTGRPPCWWAVVIGGGLGFLLIYPFLQSFASHAVPTPIKLVQGENHSQLLGFAALHWPLILFAMVSAFVPNARRIALLFGVVFLGLLIVSECVYVDDPTGGRYERTNTVMKWWGWIWSGALVSMATLLMASKLNWVKTLVTVVLLIINLYAIDIANYWYYSDTSGAGTVIADNVYTREPPVKDVFAFLKHAPDGIVLENNYGGSFTDSGIYAAFAVKPSLQGWPMHLETWHNTVANVWVLNNEIIQFYKGTLANPAPWLLANKVRYIVWNARDDDEKNAWENINANIQGDYAWREFQSDPKFRLGLWVLREGRSH